MRQCLQSRLKATAAPPGSGEHLEKELKAICAGAGVPRMAASMDGCAASNIHLFQTNGIDAGPVQAFTIGRRNALPQSGRVGGSDAGKEGGGKDGGKAKKGSSKAANFNKVGEGREGDQFPKRPHHEAEKDNKDKVIDKGKGDANPGGVSHGAEGSAKTRPPMQGSTGETGSMQALMSEVTSLLRSMQMAASGCG